MIQAWRLNRHSSPGAFLSLSRTFKCTTLSLFRVFWEKNRPESTVNLESKLGTECSSGDDLIRQVFENRLQKLQFENIELEAKYKAVKNELENYRRLNDALESQVVSLEEKKDPKDLIEYKKSSQSRIEKLELEIEKYKLERFHNASPEKSKDYSVKQYNNLVKCELLK